MIENSSRTRANTSMQKYSITYREEFIVEVEAADKEDALKKAANSKNWEMLQEGHLDFFKVEEN